MTELLSVTELAALRQHSSYRAAHVRRGSPAWQVLKHFVEHTTDREVLLPVAAEEIPRVRRRLDANLHGYRVGNKRTLPNPAYQGIGLSARDGKLYAVRRDEWRTSGYAPRHNEHGTAARARQGCKCQPCHDALRAVEREYDRRRRERRRASCG